MKRILVADDERLALNGLMQILTELTKGVQITGFLNPKEALAFALEHAPDVAFLDISMPELDGVSLADALKKAYPFVNIIFTTGYSEYASDAFALHASGYIMKPVTREKVREELAHLRYAEEEKKKRLRVTALSGFEAFADEVPLSFRYQKTKELFALLIDRRGALVSNAEIARALWPDDAGDEHSHFSYISNLRADLAGTLTAAGFPDCIVSRYGSVSILTGALDCDYYEFLRDGSHAKEAERGEYLRPYPWAEGVRNMLKKRGRDGEAESLKQGSIR